MNARDKLYAYAGTPSVLPESMLDAALDAYRAEVLTEADLLPKADVVAWLLKRAHEYPTAPRRQESVPDAIARLASKVERGAVRPDNLRVAGGTVLAVPAGSTPDFFEIGHSYTHRNGSDFHCVTVTAHPQTGERLAMGWHIDNWGHAPAVVGINQWRHEYDGVQAPQSTGDSA